MIRSPPISLPFDFYDRSNDNTVSSVSSSSSSSSFTATTTSSSNISVLQPFIQFMAADPIVKLLIYLLIIFWILLLICEMDCWKCLQEVVQVKKCLHKAAQVKKCLQKDEKAKKTPNNPSTANNHTIVSMDGQQRISTNTSSSDTYPPTYVELFPDL